MQAACYLAGGSGLQADTIVNHVPVRVDHGYFDIDTFAPDIRNRGSDEASLVHIIIDREFFLQPGGGLSTAKVKGKQAPESFTQPAPYLDPTVRCLTFTSAKMKQDLEVTGPVTLYLEAAIDKTETNWMADRVDVDEKGNKMLVCTG